MEEYDRSDKFPVTISVDNPERYTFAVFGKNEFEAELVIILKGEGYDTYIPGNYMILWLMI